MSEVRSGLFSGIAQGKKAAGAYPLLAGTPRGSRDSNCSCRLALQNLDLTLSFERARYTFSALYYTLVMINAAFKNQAYGETLVYLCAH